MGLVFLAFSYDCTYIKYPVLVIFNVYRVYEIGHKTVAVVCCFSLWLFLLLHFNFGWLVDAH